MHDGLTSCYNVQSESERTLLLFCKLIIGQLKEDRFLSMLTWLRDDFLLNLLNKSRPSFRHYIDEFIKSYQVVLHYVILIFD